MSSASVPWEKAKVLEMSTADICKIMKTAREANLLEFRYGELSFKLGDALPSPKEVADNELRRSEDLNVAAIAAKVQQAEEMQITDPVGYEELMARSLVDERAVIPEFNP